MKLSKRPQFKAVAALLMMVTATATAQTSFTRERRVPAQSADRYGNLPLGAVIRTDERYGRDGLFRGPRGWDYWNLLENPKDHQNPNLWPDKRPTYFVGQLQMPSSATLTIRGQFPHSRYFKFALYRFERNTFVALGGEDLAGWDIEPDPGSSNPYGVGADRTATTRNYTIHVVTQNAPKNRAERASNTLYAGSEDREIQVVIRIYVTDQGYDGAGLAPADSPSSEGRLVTYEAKLADGTKLSAEDVVKQFARPLGSAPPPMGLEAWESLVNSNENDPLLDPATAPARRNSRWEIFWGVKYTVVGAFQPPEQRAKIKLQSEMEGGGDPTTVYMVNYLSRKFGPLYVFRGKLPTFPDTYAGAKTMPDGQVKYWSVATVGSAPSGELWDGVFDMAVPLDKDRFYTIVVSRPEDRPTNATRENGVTWINWGPGEGLHDPRDRKDWGMLLMRFMVCQPEWEHSPTKVRTPGMEKSIMGPYYPKGYYTTKAEFEAKGPEEMKDTTPVAGAQQTTVKPYTITGTRDMRFGEILVVKESGIEVYNTTGLNDCPPELWNALDLAQIKQQFGARAVQKNGPHFWMMDSQTVTFGEKASFGGLEARWAARLDPAIAAKAAQGSAPYTVFTPKKTQKMVYAKGKPVYELVDSDGNVYVMQAHDEQFPMESLAKLGAQLTKLPQGWRYRTRILTDDLVLDLGPDQTIHAVGDEFHQYYTRIP
jgi:hypothetical protein